MIKVNKFASIFGGIGDNAYLCHMERRIWHIACGLLTAAVTLTACQESLEERCAREAKEYTEKHCPVTVGKDIVLDSMNFDMPTRTVGYYYSLRGYIDDTLAVQGGKPRELLLRQLKNTPDLKLYKEAGYNFRYTYYSTKNKGTKLFEATFHESDYR